MEYQIKENTTLQNFFNKHYAGMSNSAIKDFFKKNEVSLNKNKLLHVNYELKKGDVLTIDKIKAKSGPKVPFKIIFEDESLIVVQKQAGQLSSGENITKKPTLHKEVRDYVEAQTKCKKSAYVVHRLDKEVGGLIIFAKSEIISEKLKDNWKKFTKKYLALSAKAPDKSKGTIDTFLVERQEKMFVCDEKTPKAVRAITHYQFKEKKGKLALFEVTLETGKKNQIRVHLSHIGCPIIGDFKYGDTRKTDIRLMAYQLTIVHPLSGKKITWEIQPDLKFFSDK